MDLQKQSRPSAGPRRPSLLPAFEPLSSSPGGLPRVTKRKFDEHARDDRKYYPTPVPTSSTGILPSSPASRHTRPAIQRSVSLLSERAPLGAVPTCDVPANGEPVLMGRSSNSSDYQFPANRLISRVHVKATYNIPNSGTGLGEISVECIGWNGCKVHYCGSVVELAKGERFVSDKPSSQIIIDVQNTRVLLTWPRTEMAGMTASRSPSLEPISIKRNPAAEQFASSPPSMCPRLQSPISPSPRMPIDASIRSTFIAGQSFCMPDADDEDDDAPVQVYEDADSPDDLPRDQTPTPAAMKPEPATTDMLETIQLIQPTGSQSSDLSEPDELSEHDEENEENDPIVHSFGPFGDNLLSKFESFNSATTPIASSPIPRKKIMLKLKSSAAASPMASPARKLGILKASPIKNHVVNQLAFSRVHSIPLSQIYSNLPADMKAVQDASTPYKFTLTAKELRLLLDEIPCVGEINREGKDAAGKPLENEFYYVPEMDDDEPRRTAVSIGKAPIRNVRKQHKQYYWKRPRC